MYGLYSSPEIAKLRACLVQSSRDSMFGCFIFVFVSFNDFIMSEKNVSKKLLLSIFF